MSSLRRKLAFSYGLLIVIILAVSAWGIYHLVRLGRAIDVILVNNYKSILAVEKMKEALERQDSSAMFLIAGHGEQARGQFAENREKFLEQLQIASGNITEPGEDRIISDIQAMYADYSRQLDSFLNSPKPAADAGRSRVYFDHLGPAFVALKDRLDDLLLLNQQAMLAANERAIRQSWRAEVSAGGMAALALLVALIFAWRFTSYVVDPISILTEKAKRIAEGDFSQHIDIRSRDEIGVLAAEFNRMAARLRDFRRSDQWQMLAEQKKSDAVIDSLTDPVIVTDRHGQVTKINRAAEQLFGVSREEIKQDGAAPLSGLGAGADILRTVQSAVAMQRPVAATDGADIVPIKVGDRERVFRLRTTPMRDPDGRLIGVVIRLEDATEIGEVDRLKDEFISVAAMKLREPLHSLRMALHALIEGHAGDLTQKQEELLLTARQDGEQLDELMNDLLELAEIQSGRRQLSIEMLRPFDLARSAIARYQTLAETKQVKLSNNVWSDMRVMADKQAVNRILDNLLSNAIRYTGHGGQVNIKSGERHDFVFISVQDTGEGIPAESLPDLFGRFVHARGTAGGGTGLGLALVKRLVEAQRGQVSVESRLGEGSTFTFSLPVAGHKVAKEGSK